MKKEQKINLEEEMTVVEQQTESMPKTKKSGVWKSVIIGGVPGVILGTAGAAFAHEINHTHHQEAPIEGISNTNVGHNVPQVTGVDMAESVNDDMSFGEAFAAAREEVGPGGVFEWNGNLYNTYTADEWEAMSNEDRQVFANNVSNNQGNDDVNEHEKPEPVNNEETSEETDDESIDVQVYNVGSVATEEGEILNVAVASVDGHDAVYVDMNNDGYVDGIFVDANDNGVIDNNEVRETPNSDLNMSYLAMMAERPEDAIYEGTPDYINDADTSSLA